jgi:hypothetical protein
MQSGSFLRSKSSSASWCDDGVNSLHSFFRNKTRLNVFDQLKQLLSIDLLFFNKILCDLIKNISMFGKQLHTSIILVLKNIINFFINLQLQITSLNGSRSTSIHASTRRLNISRTNSITHAHLFDHHLSRI